MGNQIRAEYLSKGATWINIWTTVTVSIWRVEKLGSEWWNNLPKVMTLMSGGPRLKASYWPWFPSIMSQFSCLQNAESNKLYCTCDWAISFYPLSDADSVLLCVIQEEVAPARQQANSLICVTWGTLLVEGWGPACLFPTTDSC